MKLFLILIICLGSIALEAQSGKIFFIRKNAKKKPIVQSSYKVFIDNKIVCKLGDYKYSVHDVPIGEHKVIAQFSGTEPKKASEKESLSINVEPDKSYYVILNINGSGFTINLFCEEITENTWNKYKPDLQEDTNCFK